MWPIRTVCVSALVKICISICEARAVGLVVSFHTSLHHFSLPQIAGGKLKTSMTSFLRFSSSVFCAKLINF
jgi:hypothetical protein